MNKIQLISKKIISVVLMFCIIGGMALSYPAEVNAANKKEYVVKAEGDTYRIVKNGNNITMTKDGSKDKDIIKITDGNVRISTYKYKSTNVLGKKKYNISTQNVNINGANFITNQYSTQKISYGGKVKDGMYAKYWYKKGNNGKKTFLQIGCKAKYRIRTDNLSSKNNKLCNKYVSKIKSSNKNGAIAFAAYGAAGVATAAAIVAGYILAAPVAVVVTLITAAIGGSSKSAMSVIDCYYDYIDIKDYYIDIRGLGKKL